MHNKKYPMSNIFDVWSCSVKKYIYERNTVRNIEYLVSFQFQTAMASRVLWPVLLACVSPVLMYPSGAPGCSNGGPSDFSPSHGTTVNDPILPYTVNATKSGKDWTGMEI